MSEGTETCLEACTPTLDERTVRQRFLDHARTYLFEMPLREDPSWQLLLPPVVQAARAVRRGQKP